MSYIVRPYSEQDRESVRNICVRTAPHRIRTEQKRLFLFKTNCDYYLDCEPENCFVAVETDENAQETVVGYVLCAMDCEKFAKRFMERYIPKLKEYGKMNAYFARMDMMVFGQFANFFPSHMRLCVDPASQGRGVGTLLWEELKILMQKNNAKGVAVLVEKSNKNAQEFFLKKGFSALGKVGSSMAFGFDF